MAQPPRSRGRTRGFWGRLIELNARALAVELRALANQLEAAAPGPPAVAYPVLFRTTKGDLFMSDIQITDDSGPLTATASYVDAKGNPTSPAATPEWTSSDSSVATVSASEDGLTATVTIVGGLGAAQITATDPEGEGTDDDVVSVGTVSVVAGRAVVGDIKFAPAS